jgi:hypothetical protein
MRPQILKTWDQSFAIVLFKHYVSPLIQTFTVRVLLKLVILTERVLCRYARFLLLRPLPSDGDAPQNGDVPRVSLTPAPTASN